MDNNYELWRSFPRALSMALRVRTDYGSEESKFYRRLATGASRIGTVGLNLKAHVVAAIWRTMFRKAPTLVVIATPTQGQWFFQAAEQLLTRCEAVRNRVWIGREHSGLTMAHSTTMQAVAIRPHELVGHVPVDSLVLVPNLDAVDGAYLRVAAELEKEGRITLAVNAPRSRLPA